MRYTRQEAAAINAAWQAIIAWARGLDNPDVPARSIYHVRPGYLQGLLLGVRHAVERAADDYTGPIVADARQLCDAAAKANEAHTRRLVGESAR